MEHRRGEYMVERERQIEATHAVLIDVDRTLLKSEAFSAFVYRAVGEMGVSNDVLDEVAREQVAAQHNCFDYIKRIYELQSLQFTPGTLWQIIDTIKRQNQVDGEWPPEFIDSVLVDGVGQLFAGFDQTGTVSVLCTSGGEMTQRIKLAIVQDILGMEVPWVILGLDQQRKAAMIAETYDAETGVFNFDELAMQATASNYVRNNRALRQIRFVDVIDDKWVNVSDIPDGLPVRGWLVKVAELPDDGAERLTLDQVAADITQHSIDK